MLFAVLRGSGWGYRIEKDGFVRSRGYVSEADSDAAIAVAKRSVDHRLMNVKL